MLNLDDFNVLQLGAFQRPKGNGEMPATLDLVPCAAFTEDLDNRRTRCDNGEGWSAPTWIRASTTTLSSVVNCGPTLTNGRGQSLRGR